MPLKTRVILVLVIGTILGLSLSLGGELLHRDRPAGRDVQALQQARLFTEVMERVKRDYVDPLDDEVLIESAVRGMVSELDRHSAYLDAQEYQDVRITASGRYSGVGLEVSTSDGAIVVVAPIDDTPAQHAGILSGDEIVAIDDLSVVEDGLDETVDRMRGRAGTPVSLTVRRDGYDDPLTFHLTRRRIQVVSVRHEVLDDWFGYLRLSQFNDATVEEAAHAIDEMLVAARESTGEPLHGLVLDLRNNPGGILEAAVGIADLFLDEGMIVSARGRTPESQFSHEAHRGDVLNGAALAVLVNGGSASASEIVAGALQDNGRATLVGTTTFGKGLVQTVMPLSRGRAVKLTTSRYFTPSGASIHETGIAPDIAIPASGDYPRRAGERLVDREGDEQLIEALEYLRSQRFTRSQAPD